MRTIPKNCQFCESYLASDYKCGLHDCPVSNVATCSDWKLRFDILSNCKSFKLVDYDFYGREFSDGKNRCEDITT